MAYPISVAVLISTGKLVMECVIETKAVTIIDFSVDCVGLLHVTSKQLADRQL
jgi:hypothetical protein